MQRGINLVGVLSAAVGLGAAGRATLDVLQQRDIPHVAIDIDLGAGAAVERMPASAPRALDLRSLPYAATLVHMNPDMFENLILRWRRRLGYEMKPTLNAIVPFWELPALPAAWVPSISAFDVVLAPTKFIRGALERSLPVHRRPLIWDYPQAVNPPMPVTPDRERWLGERANRTTFLSTFDILSEIERKNPWAAIRAFQEAFRGRDDASLLVKVNHARVTRHAERFAELERLAADDKRVVLLSDSLSRDDLWSLYASVDAYVSLHRAEGLGLGLMEAMAVGKPVVATGWSGNMDFSTDANCMLVPYTLVQVSATHPNYRGESAQKWADPDLHKAAAAMRTLADTPGLMGKMGAQGEADMRRRRQDQAQRGVLDDLADTAIGGTAQTPEHRERVRAGQRHALQRAVALSNLVEHAKRAGVRELRRVGLKPPPPPDERQWGPPLILP